MKYYLITPLVTDGSSGSILPPKIEKKHFSGPNFHSSVSTINPGTPNISQEN